MKKVLCLVLAFMMLWSVTASAMISLDVNVADVPETAKNYEGAIIASYDENGILFSYIFLPLFVAVCFQAPCFKALAHKTRRLV